MPEIGLAIGAFRAAVITRDAGVLDAVRRRYAGFLSDTSPDWRLRVAVGPLSARPGDGIVVRRDGAPDTFDIARYDFEGRVDLARRTADVTCAEAHALTLDALVRIVVSLALVPARGLLVHAASLVRGGHGYLFPGVSGAGKTTLARLSSDAILLSDELSMVTLPETGPAAVHGTPFWGDLARGGRMIAAELAGVHFPRHADRHAATPLGERQALTRLLPTVMSFAREADVVARVVDLAVDLVARVPCFVLDFRPDRGFWEAIEGV